MQGEPNPYTIKKIRLRKEEKEHQQKQLPLGDTINRTYKPTHKISRTENYLAWNQHRDRDKIRPEQLSKSGTSPEKI